MLKKILPVLILFFSAQVFGQNPISSFSYEQQESPSTCVQFTNTSTGNIVSFEWTIMDATGSIFNSEDIIYCFGDTGCCPVRLVVWDIMGNTDTSIQTICVHVNSSIFVPNAFTPNGDGINDVYFIYGTWLQENKIELRIFGYWGGLVFSTFDLQEGWDGKFQNKNNQVPMGAYLAELIWFDNMNQKHTSRYSIMLLR